MRRLLLGLAILVAGATALGQPMPQAMIDPSQMSGIPRPDPTVPAGTLTVRVLRGDFAHPLVGETVTLDGPGGARTAKVDETAHAVFTDLTTGRGPYVVKCSAFGEDLVSQPIEMPASPGVKIMLVFKVDEKEHLGDVDGVARTDARLPSGTVEVKVVDENDQPLAKIDVVLAHAKKDADKVEEKTAVTDGAGRARFTGLAVSDADGYLASARREGAAIGSKPFRLQGNGGTLIGLRSLKVTRDGRAVSIGNMSHFIAEVKDDVVEVIENLVLQNSGTEPYDPGPAGIVIPLPDDAEGAQTGPNAPPGLTVEGKRATWKGVLPAGDTALTIAFVLPQHDAAVEIKQVMPFPMERTAIITDRFDGMQVGGEGLILAEREMNGRNFWVVTGPSVKAGGVVDVKLTGLPHASPFGRYLATTLALLIALWGVAFSIYRKGAPAPRGKLEQRRAELLDQLAAAAPDGKAREELLAKLEKIYRELDDTGAR